MNKLGKILLSILGGIDVTFKMFTPALISIVWIELVNMSGVYMYLLLSLGMLATLFRAIKIGWLKNE